MTLPAGPSAYAWSAPGRSPCSPSPCSCGAATAAVGPISFVGLAVPLAARSLVGHDQRWIAVLCLVLGPVWLLLADTLGRVLLAPEEVPVGVIAALFGAPVFVALVRRRKVPAL